MSLTHIVRKVFVPRQKQLERYNDAAIALQHDVLMRLVERGTHTEYGRKVQMNRVATYDDFAKQVPVNSYEELKADIDRMRHGESNVLWPGRVRFFAKSSGTTNDKSKFIPVSREGLHRIHSTPWRSICATIPQANFSMGVALSSAVAMLPTTIG